MARQISRTDTPQLAQQAPQSSSVDGGAWSGQETGYEPPRGPRGFTPSKTLGVAIVALTLAIALIIAFVR